LKEYREQETCPYLPYAIHKTKVVVGSGVTGSVYSGTYQGQDIAIKELKPAMTDKQIEMETKLAWIASIHPNIIRTIGRAKVDSCHVICFELAVMSLFDLWNISITENESLKIELILPIISDICGGMNFLNTMSIAHRDIKIQNFLIVAINDSEFIVKMCDFGSGKILMEGESNTADVGTRLYRAPETYTNKYDHSADIWSLGIVVSHLLQRDTGFCSKILANPTSLNNCPHPFCDFPSDLRCDLVAYRATALEILKTEPIVSKLIKKCLNFEPAQRPTFLELIRNIKKIKEVTQDRNFPQWSIPYKQHEKPLPPIPSNYSITLKDLNRPTTTAVKYNMLPLGMEESQNDIHVTFTASNAPTVEAVPSLNYPLLYEPVPNSCRVYFGTTPTPGPILMNPNTNFFVCCKRYN